MNLPWYISWPIQITVCIGIIPAIIFSVILLFGGSLNFGVGPFSFFSLRGPSHAEASHASKIDRRTIENIPNVLEALLRKLSYAKFVLCSFGMGFYSLIFFKQICVFQVTVNVHIQDSGSGVTRLERSHSLAITTNPSAERPDQSNNLHALEDADAIGSNQSGDKHERNELDSVEKKKRPVETITNNDLASGDWTSIGKSDTIENPVDTKISETVRQSRKLQSGGGDN